MSVAIPEIVYVDTIKSRVEGFYIPERTVPPRAPQPTSQHTSPLQNYLHPNPLAADITIATSFTYLLPAARRENLTIPPWHGTTKPQQPLPYPAWRIPVALQSNLLRTTSVLQRPSPTHIQSNQRTTILLTFQATAHLYPDQSTVKPR